MSDELHELVSDKNNEAKEVKDWIKLQEEAGIAVDVNHLHSAYKSKAVDRAAQSGSLSTLRYLIEELNANLRVDVEEGKENLLFWSALNTPDVIAYIIDPKNRIVERFCDATTPLQAVMMAGNESEVRRLVKERPSRIREKNVSGHTALFYAAIAGQEALIELITGHGELAAECINFKDADTDDQIYLGRAKRLAMQTFLLPDEQKMDPVKQIIRLYEKVKTKDHEIYLQLALHYRTLTELHDSRKEIQMAIICLQQALVCTQLMDDKSPNKKFLLAQLSGGLEEFKGELSSMQLATEAKKWGFQECIDVARDGNCFFHAVLDQLKLHDPKYTNDPSYAAKTQEMLRAETMAHISEHASSYAPFLTDEEDFQAFITRAGKPGQWAHNSDDLLMLAFSRQANVTIVILRSDGAEPIIYKRPTADAKILYVGYEVENHYQSLGICSPDQSTSKNMKEKLETAEVDDFSTEVDNFLCNPQVVAEPLLKQSAGLENKRSNLEPSPENKRCKIELPFFAKEASKTSNALSIVKDAPETSKASEDGADNSSYSACAYFS